MVIGPPNFRVQFCCVVVWYCCTVLNLRVLQIGIQNTKMYVLYEMSSYCILFLSAKFITTYNDKTLLQFTMHTMLKRRYLINCFSKCLKLHKFQTWNIALSKRNSGWKTVYRIIFVMKSWDRVTETNTDI